MTSKERVLAAMAGQPVDRLPQFDEYWGEFVTIWRAERQPPPGVSCPEHYGIDIRICPADETPFFSQAAVIEDDGVERVRRDGWGRTLRERKGTWFYEVIEPYATDRDAFLQAEFDDPADDRRYASWLAGVQRYQEQELAAFCKIGGSYLRTTFYRGETEFLEDIAGDPTYARELADKMADHLLQIGLESIRRGGFADTGIWMFDDIAHNGGLMLSPKSFERIFLPGYARIVAGCREAGVRHFVFHSDGDIRALLPMLAEIGVDGINPVEPRAGMDAVALSEAYAGRLTFIGGIDNTSVLVNGPEVAIREHVAPIAKAARERGGIICGTHSIGPDVPVRHYEAYHATVRAH